MHPQGGGPGNGATLGGGQGPPPLRRAHGGEPVSRQIAVELASSAKSVPLARSLVTDFLRRNGGESACDVASLLTSELVTNAVVHGGTTVGLSASLSDHRLRVEASDRSTAVPTMREAADADTGGRGLMVVATLASDWGYEQRPTGKSVWFELAL